MAASLTILLGVVRFRLRKLEMGNLAAAGAIATTLSLPWHDVGLRVAAAALLNVLVYLNNDYLDVGADLQSDDRDRDAGHFLHAHMPEAARLQWVLAAALVVLTLAHGPGLLLAAAVGGGICVAYSARLKHVAFADIAAMAAWGVAMPMLGSPLDSGLGWVLAVQLGLVSAAFESMQVVRDRAVDEEQGIVTTAVALGTAATLRVARVFLLACALFSAACIHPAIGALPLLAALLPMGEQTAARDWNRIKALCGVAFLASCALIWTDGQSSGLWLQLGSTDTLGAG